MSKKDDLFEIADSQQGYFTTNQAVKCGYSRTNIHRYLSSGEWIKEQRAIYRLAHYPVTTHPDLVLWSLWSRDRNGEVQGVWSHETALEIHELSDAMPAKLHMTVSKGFRKGTSKLPQNLVLHFIDLPKTEVIAQQGYLVTSPLRTIVDIVEDGKLSEDLLVQAIHDALRKGMVSRKDLKKRASCNANSKLMRILNVYKI